MRTNPGTRPARARTTGPALPQSAAPEAAWWRGTLAAGAFFLLLSALKMATYLTDGRFWAEEGRYFMPAIKHVPWYDGLRYLFNGHWELATNCVIFLGSLVEFRHAPLVTTYLAFFCQCLPIAVLVGMRERLGLKFGPLLMFLTILVGLPQSSELWAQSPGLHFHFALLAAVIAAIPPDLEKTWLRWLFRVLLLAAGLSGIPANALAPVFLWLSWREKDRERWLQAGILSATSLLQVFLLWTHPAFAEHRTLAVNPLLIALSALAQQLIAPLVMQGLGRDDGVLFLQAALQGDALALFMSAVACLPAVALAVYIWKHPDRQVITLLVSMAWVAAFSVTLALDDRDRLISTWFGGRYFFVPNCLLFLALSILLSRSQLCSPPDWRRNLSHMLAQPSQHAGWLLLALYLGVVFVMSVGRLPLTLPGVSWPIAYRQAIQEGNRSIPIWPAANGWFITNYDWTVTTNSPATASP